MHPMNPIVSGLLNGLSIGNMLRRTAMEQQLMQQNEQRQARMAEIEDLKLADLMQERGIRPLGAEDIVNRMTGTVQGTIPGQQGGSTGQFSENTDAGKVPTLQAEINPGTLPQTVEVPDDNKYVKFRGEEYVVPGQRERTATADAAKRREIRMKAEESRLTREMIGQEMPEISRILKRPTNYKYMPDELEAATRAAQAYVSAQNLIESRAERDKLAREKANKPSFSTATTAEGVMQVARNPDGSITKTKIGDRPPREFAPTRGDSEKPNATLERQKLESKAVRLFQEAWQREVVEKKEASNWVDFKTRVSNHYNGYDPEVRHRVLSMIDEMKKDEATFVKPDAAATQKTVSTGAPKQLTDPAIAADYLKKAGGDKDKARELAKKDNWTF